MNYKNKYFKYKLKYLKTKQLYGGAIYIDRGNVAVSLKFVYQNNTQEEFPNVFFVPKNILIEELIGMIKEVELYENFEVHNHDNKELIQIVLINDEFTIVLDNHTEKIRIFN